MPRFDDPSRLRPTIDHMPAVRRGRRQRCAVGSSRERPRLRLVYSRRVPSLPFGIHPALPSTLAFAAVSMAALAYAAFLDVANGVGAIATDVGARLQAVSGRRP